MNEWEWTQGSIIKMYDVQLVYNAAMQQHCSLLITFEEHFYHYIQDTLLFPFFFSTRTLYTLLAHILLTTIKNYVLTWVSGIAANDTEFLNSILIISVLIIIVFKWCCNWNYFPSIWILWPFLESCSSLVL